MPHRLVLVSLLLSIPLFGCHSSAPDNPQEKAMKPANLDVTSRSFAAGAATPKQFTGEGADESPALAWSGSPAGVKSFAVICDDPDAPSARNPAPDPWVHWVIHNIPATANSLPPGIARDLRPSAVSGAVQGTNSWPADNIGYRGPMPPPRSGPHRYFFHVYALDCEIPAGATPLGKPQLLAAMKGHILAEGQVMGTYERQ